MIQLITVRERNRRTATMETIVSHGVDTENGEVVILPQDPPAALGAVFNTDHGWHIPDLVKETA